MHHEIEDLRRFYYQRALGRVVQRILRDRLTVRWQPQGCLGMTMAGYGFAAPLLRPYLQTARRVTALMPDAQGAMTWPVGQANHSVSCEQTAWPVETGSVDRLILLHALETSDDPAGLLAEAWRALGPGGRLIVMVPNRAGLWAASDRTPFGLGRSYTPGQLEAQTRKAGFTTEWNASAVYIPPSDRRFWLRSAQMWERTGVRISRMLIAGVAMIELSKQARAPVGPVGRAAVRNPRALLQGVGSHQPVQGRRQIPDPSARTGPVDSVDIGM